MIKQRMGRRALLRSLAAASACLAGGRVLSPAAAHAQAKFKPSPRKHIVVLDAGHGGIDPGAIGLSGIYEKEIALTTTKLLAQALEASRRYTVVLTRSDDEFIALQDRVARARAAQGELFLSIHADALPDPDMRGASVFTLSEKASDREAAALAARENKADLIAGIDLSRHAPEVSTILIDLARRQTNNLSIGLARRLVGELGHEVRLLNNSHRSAGFAVLKAPDIPSALVELGALSNRDEDRALRTPAYRQRLATSLARSVNDYFDFVAKA
ncbi:MAG: N-acetylmuramoyl-L-alanine amidase [Alphaproteobacteria bacterium]|nr:N-acetylmuramoyl-L-alanine amidase [Alphaproteobacteria bacterium]